VKQVTAVYGLLCIFAMLTGAKNYIVLASQGKLDGRDATDADRKEWLNAYKAAVQSSPAPVPDFVEYCLRDDSTLAGAGAVLGAVEVMVLD